MRFLTEEEKEKNRKERRKKQAVKMTDEFMQNVNEFVGKKYGGDTPSELRCSMELIRRYYLLFTQLSLEIEDLDSLTAQSRYGTVVHPLVAALNSVVIRLEKSLSETGLTMKSQKLMDVVTIQEEESPLEKYLNGLKGED